MSKKSKARKLHKFSGPDLDMIAEQMRRLEAAGWLRFHGFRSTDGHVAVEPSENLLRMIAVSGMPAELLVAQLLHNMDELEAIKRRAATPPTDEPYYV